MIYSRFLYTEFEQPHNDDGEGGYTIFSTPQPLGVYATDEQCVGFLNFAVLWDGEPDTRVIYLAEQAIVRDVMAPVRLLHAHEGMLTVVYKTEGEEFDFDALKTAWEDIGSGVQLECWTVEVIEECVVGHLLFGGRLFRKYAPEIMASGNLGMSFYTEEDFLFADDWSEDEMFGSGKQQDSDDEPPPNMKLF
ncbi:hypothetical protein I8746_10545 [Pseudomonas sp. USTB-Z]|uniref:hypothetical protein n=1 Tax=Pseudomonas sp. USTB-Z TaxID=2794351 RepID=UPI001C829284|nr:hypothetical protein [Pseudomonas sp. USTB-Z]MBX6690041.1 hypothetical protein [Pseudomonas sp. USTB-Z]